MLSKWGILDRFQKHNEVVKPLFNLIMLFFLSCQSCATFQDLNEANLRAVQFATTWYDKRVYQQINLPRHVTLVTAI